MGCTQILRSWALSSACACCTTQSLLCRYELSVSSLPFLWQGGLQGAPKKGIFNSLCPAGRRGCNILILKHLQEHQAQPLAQLHCCRTFRNLNFPFLSAWEFYFSAFLSLIPTSKNRLKSAWSSGFQHCGHHEGFGLSCGKWGIQDLGSILRDISRDPVAQAGAELNLPQAFLLPWLIGLIFSRCLCPT